LSVPRAILLLMVTAMVMLATGDPRLATPARGQTKPNIIFVLTDDQFAGTLSSMPALNSNVTSRGVVFDNMTAGYPLCCPNRAVMLRGQYAHNTHIYSNDAPLGGWKKFHDQGMEKSTFATWLHDAGYKTGMFGKYMNNYTDPSIPPGWDRWYAWNGPKQGWTAVNDQGTQRSLIPRAADRVVGDRAFRFLENRVDSPTPFFAFVNFGAEHAPYYHDKADDGAFEGVGVPRTDSFNEEDVTDKPTFVRNLAPLSEEDVARMDQNYADGLRSLMRVDRFIGKASALLKSKGEMRNTYFVFYSDNGAHFGQHRLPHGKLMPYEEDTNFPLIVRGPGITEEDYGQKRTQLAGSHDIAPTLARMGGARVPGFVDGRSILPVAQNPTSAWPRTAVLSERKIDDIPPSWEMLRLSDANYTRYDNGDKEYYDLIKDPLQLDNALGGASNAPNQQTQDYYEQRLDALANCGNKIGQKPCRAAEDAPLMPAGSTP
jgi:arylsulfatase A-like enzyme